MHLLGSITSWTLLLTIIVPSIVATPVEQSSNHAALEQRAVARPPATIGNRQCSNPAQINLINDPGINSVAGCGWKMWAACTAIAGGACFLPCLDGGFVDPLCDGCIAALGALGCHSCVENHGLHASLQGFLADKQDRITQKLQSDYCVVPKPLADIPKVSVRVQAGPTTPAGASVPAPSAATA